MKRSLLLMSILLLLCGLHANAQNPSVEWVKQMGGNASEQGYSVTTDLSGNVYSTGLFSATADFNIGFGNGILTANGYSDIYISKHNSSGVLIWVKQIGKNANNIGTGIITDSYGNVYVTGSFSGNADFNPGSGINNLSAFGPTDAFILKLDSSGLFIWARNLGTSLVKGSRIARAIALNEGNVYITGEIDEGKMFVSRIDTSGNFIWTKTMGGNRQEYSYAIAVDKLGNVYTTGKFSSDSVDFDPGIGVHYLVNSQLNASTYSYDAFISKLDSLGNFVWAKKIGGISGEEGNGIAIDADGNVIASGYFRNTVDFNPNGTPFLMTVSAYQDAYIIKYTSAGVFIWAKQMGGTGTTTSRGLALDKEGGIYTSGWFGGITDFDPGTGALEIFNLQALASSDIYISKLDSTGNFKWAKNFGGNAPDIGYFISVDQKKSVYATGLFSSDIFFDSTLLSSNFKNIGIADIFILKINQTCSDTSSSKFTVDICQDEYEFNGNTYHKTGIYKQKLLNASGCDSTVILNLTLKGVLMHPVINVNVFLLGTTLPYATYQWLLHENEISGATNRTFTVTKNGKYRVVVTNIGGCIDTSDIYTITNHTNINRVKNESQIAIFPNPVDDIINIVSPVAVNVTISSIEGKTMKQKKSSTFLSLKDLSAGIYIMRISDKEGNLLRIEKVVKR